MCALEGDEAGSTKDSTGALAISMASVPLMMGLMTAVAAPEDETTAVAGTAAD